MRQFLIAEDQANLVLTVLGEVPAKLSFKAMMLLHSLKEYVPTEAPVTEAPVDDHSIPT